MPYTANGAWEQLIEGSRKVDFSLAIVRTSNTNIPQDKIESVSLESTATSNNSINFGTTCSDSVKITLRDYDSTLLFEGAKLCLTVSVQNDDGTSTADYQVGMFYVDSVKKTETYGNGLNLEITAYDGFYKTEQIYSPSASLGANPTIRAVVTDILQKCGLTDRFDAFIDETAWSNTITLESIKADLTCRQQIGYLAALQGCFAKFNDEGNLTAKWYTDTAKVITRDEQFMAEMTQDMKSDLTVAMIETGTSDNVIVKPSSALGYSIKFENPYITDSIADSIYTNKVSGEKIKFRPLTVRWRGNPQIVVGDIVKVEDKTGNYLTCYVMQKTLSFDGGMSETYKCYGESTSSVAFNKSPSDVKFERIYSRMEEAVKAATSAVKQTEGSTFELIPKTKDSTENIGFRLYYKDSQDSAFDKCVIMATAGGIGFSTNGGESYDAAAIYFAKDSSGVIHGYINGEFIQAGTISSDKINTSQLIISKGNVEGLESDLTTINNNVTTANSNASAAVITANSAKTTANNANTTASAAQTTANGVNTVIGQWCYNNNTTYINGGKIATGTIEAEAIKANSITADKLAAGAITAEKVNVGWQSGNLASDWYNPDGLSLNSYFTLTIDSSNNYYSTVYVKTTYSGTLRCCSKPFYLAAGDRLKYGGEIYNKTATLSGFYIEYSSTSNGNYAVEVASNSGTSGTTQKNATYTATASGWYRLTCAFDNPAAGTYHSGVYCFRSVKGNLIVNGQIESTDGSTYFDLDKSLICTNSPYYQTLLRAGSIVTQSRTSASSNYSEVGGVEAAVEINGPNEQTYQEIRWCGNANSLRIGHGNAGNIDPYLIFQTLGTVDLYKPLNAKAITSTEKISAETMSTSSAYASGFVHTRTSGISSYEGNTVKLIAGRANQWENMGNYSKNVVAIELSSGDTVYARMNVSESWGSACGVITLDGSNGISAPLELGKTEMWFNGNSLTNSSSEKYKTDILPYTDNALSLVNSSVIYSYKYKSDGENALTKYGLVIERECPQEVVDNSGDAISLYSMCSILWKSVQELSAKVNTLENSKLR